MSAGDIHFVSFRWKSAGPEYTLNGTVATHRGGDRQSYMPVLSDLLLRPGGGRVYFEVRLNADNVLLGFCDGNSDPNVDMTAAKGCYYLDLQKGTVVSDGKVFKKLWRLLVPISGGIFGILFSCDDGTARIYLNGEYQGLAFDETLGLRGKPLRFCVGIAGLDAGNRDIGTGNKSATISANPEYFNIIRKA